MSPQRVGQSAEMVKGGVRVAILDSTEISWVNVGALGEGLLRPDPRLTKDFQPLPKPSVSRPLVHATDVAPSLAGKAIASSARSVTIGVT